MVSLQNGAFIIGPDDLILITGANGFIGFKVVENLLGRGFRNLRCFARPFGRTAELEALSQSKRDAANIELFKGNLLSREDCLAATKDAAVVFHLAAGRGEKSFADAFMNSAVTTRNLLDAVLHHGCLRRFVNVSSLSVYTNCRKPHGRVLDESCAVEEHPESRKDAYSFAKLKQDQIVKEYGAKYGVPHVTVRPGYVYGPGNEGITARVGIGTFGIFLHLGGSNSIPFTYVDNCADAIVLAGLQPGVEGEVFNIVDDGAPSSRQFLRSYKREVRHFASIYVPHAISYVLCYLWEKYSAWSQGQLPPAFNVRDWHITWKKTRYSNEKLKSQLGWAPRVSTQDAMARFFEACKREASSA